MVRLKSWAAIVTVLTAMLGGLARGDILVRSDGGLLDGKVVSQDAKEIVFQPDGAEAGAAPQKLDRSTVSQILLTDEHGALLSGAAATQPAAHWNVPAAPIAPPITRTGAGPTYYVIPLHGEVGVTVLAGTLEKSLEDALKRKPTVVVLDIDSPGGLVEESKKIIDVLHHYNKKLRIVALTNQDLSAAAIFSLSVRKIYVKSSSTIGAATSYIPGNMMLPPKIEEKMQSAWRAVGRNSAEEGRHEPLLADAMIDNDMELQLDTSSGKPVVKEGAGDHTLCRKGKILTLSSHEAVECGLAAGEADDVAELGSALKFPNWTECKGLGTLLAEALPIKAKAYDAEVQKIHARFEQNIRIAINSDPSQSVTTVTHYVPQPPMPPHVGPYIPGRHLNRPPMIPPTPFTMTRTHSTRLWKSDSLACVVALQQCEANIKDAVSLSQAFERSTDAEVLQQVQEKLGTIRVAIFDDRNKYGQGIVVARNNNTPQSPADSAFRSNAPSFNVNLPTNAMKTEQLGGQGGVPFVMADAAGKPVVGFRYRLGSWGGKACLRRFEPLYAQPAGDPPRNYSDVVARDGYVVGGIVASNDVTNILAVQITFVRYKDGHVVATDSYPSDWIGQPDASSTHTLAGKGETVLGIFGRRGLNLDAMGLVVSSGEKGSK